jgi:DNA-binding NarL/FixJ family response regulator
VTEGAVLSAKVTQAVVAGYLERSAETKPNPRIDRLTEREREILLLLGEGKSNGEISAELFLGLGTVKDHVSSILTKLQVSNRVQAALAAHDAGLLRGDGG